jgi:hypothetical protein
MKVVFSSENTMKNQTFVVHSIGQYMKVVISTRTPFQIQLLECIQLAIDEGSFFNSEHPHKSSF